jgi:hypothetical protein
MCVPLEACVCVVPGDVDPAVLAILENRGFDQAPVYDSQRRIVWGLVETCRLRFLAECGERLSTEDPALSARETWFRIGHCVRIGDILDTMAQQRAVLVVQESDATEYGHAEWTLGLMTISDLNRHPLRAELYSAMSHVEAGLADLVEKAFPDPWTWIRTLNEGHQVGILGYWELSRRRGVDVGPVAATTLSQLIQAVSRSKELRTKLGFQSRNEFEALTGSIPELRNAVMHPVRPLILEQDDVSGIRKTVLAVHELADRIRKASTV